MLRPDKDADEIARLQAELVRAWGAEQACRQLLGTMEMEVRLLTEQNARLRDALTIIANSAYPNRQLHEGDHLWRWCRAEDTARQAIEEVS